MTQQAEAAQMAHERSASPQVGATTERVVVAAEPMVARPAPSVGVTREKPQRADSEAYDAEYAAQRAE